MEDPEIKKYLDEWIIYNPESGKFFWKKTSGRGTRVSGRECGTTICNGYRHIKIQGKIFKCHRIAFLIMEGRFPNIIDHINRDRGDNRWENLREVTSSENALNRSLSRRNKTGYTGVYLNKNENTYIVTYGKNVIKRTKDLNEAIYARKQYE